MAFSGVFQIINWQESKAGFVNGTGTGTGESQKLWFSKEFQNKFWWVKDGVIDFTSKPFKKETLCRLFLTSNNTLPKFSIRWCY